MHLTNLQAEKVKEIVACYGREREVEFKAPTGSGKTLIASHVIAEIINAHPLEKFVFIIATISNSDLPLAFEQKINAYKADLITGDFEVEYIESPSNDKNNKSDAVSEIRLVRNKVYIFGKATFGKGRIFTEQEVITDFIFEAKTKGYKIVYIRDEAHIGSKKESSDNGTKTFENLMHSKADFILKMTATFTKETRFKRIELKEKDLIDETKNEGRFLIKGSLEKLIDDTTSDKELLNKAILKFKTIQTEYKKLDVVLRPAMLIQVDNEPNKKNIAENEAFHRALAEIKDTLSRNGLSWVQYFGSDNKDFSNIDNKDFTLHKITRNNDTTDCIIFKIGPSTGWDIPRACMLLQLRNICSSSLNIQTIGRIKRNPYPNLEKNQVTDKYYIYTNAPKIKDKDYVIYDYKIKEKFRNEELAVIKLIKTGRAKLETKTLEDETRKFLERSKHELLVRINECFTGEVYKEQDKKLVIKNPLLLLRRIKSFENNLRQEQLRVIETVHKVYAKYFPHSLEWEKLEIILLAYYSTNIKAIYQKCLPVKVDYKLELERVNPDVYQEIFEETNDNEIDVSDETYLFEVKKDGKVSDRGKLDSQNEEIVSVALKTLLELFPVKIWAKNQKSSNIFGEYFDDFHNERKSYFDFVIKFENGNYLYLEVKGDEDSDIDLEKTRLLEKAYQDYFNNLNYNFFSQKFVICILKVKDKKLITPVCFYDRKVVNLKDGASLAEIIKELAR